MRFCKISFTVFLYYLLTVLWIDAHAQTIPVAPSEINFAGVSVQLTPSARQHLQQSLNVLYIDRVLLLNQIETLNQLRPILDARLNAHGIPLDFRYACPPFAEADYDPSAYWGLGRQQAEQLQLWVDPVVDSRRHFTVATEAVLPSLNQFQQQNKQWVKTLFQHLASPVNQSVAESDSTHWLLDDLQAPAAFWTILARKTAFEHEQALLQLTLPFILLEYDEGAGKTLSEIADRLKINADRVLPYNNWLLSDRIPAGSNLPVLLRLTPEEYLAVKTRLAAKGAKPNAINRLASNDLGFPVLRRLDAEQNHKSVIYYQINSRRGVQAQLCDNPITLAYYGKLTVSTFLTINDLPVQDILLKPGEVYYLKRKAKRAKIPFHVVQQSQTLWDISAIYGIRLKSLLRYNRMKPTQRVQAGRIVWMQRRRPTRYPVEYQSIPPVEREVVDPPVVASTDVRSLPDSIQTSPKGPTPVVRVDPPAPLNDAKNSLIPRPVSVDPIQPIVPAGVTKIHVVKPGQTYYSIAKLYGTTVAQLCDWNKVSIRQPLQVGQELLINTVTTAAASPGRRQPPVTKMQSPKPLYAPTVTIKKVRYHLVKPGETVYRIALNQGVSVPDLMRWNGLKNFTIEVGQRLIIQQTDK